MLTGQPAPYALKDEHVLDPQNQKDSEASISQNE
jgi:hypothetical protein